MTVADIIASITKGPLPFKVEAYDGSSIGSGDITVRLENEDALAYIATAPGDLGLARAYVTGALTVEGKGSHPAHPYALFDDLQKAYSTISISKNPRAIAKLIRELRNHHAFRRLPIPPGGYPRVAQGSSRCDGGSGEVDASAL